MLVLGGCGGSSDPPSPGTLLGSAAIVALQAAAIDARSQANGLYALSGAAKCDVAMHSLDYQTTGVAANELTNATGVVLWPSGPNCPAGPYPLQCLCARHGNIQSPFLANSDDSETRVLAATFAAQALHARTAAADFAKRGVKVPVIDVDSTIRAIAAQQSTTVDLSIYHGESVLPLCMVALRDQLFNPAR